MNTKNSQKLVYVVEDNEDQLFLLRMILSDAGFAVVTESDADKVLDGVNLLMPDIIMLDVMLPSRDGLDGFELCGRIRQLETGARPKVVLVSAIAQKSGTSADKLATQAGADAFVSKPFDPPVLIDRLLQLFAA